MPLLDPALQGRQTYAPAFSRFAVGSAFVFLDFRLQGFDVLVDAIGLVLIVAGSVRLRPMHTAAAHVQLLATVSAVLSLAEIGPWILSRADLAALYSLLQLALTVPMWFLMFGMAIDVARVHRLEGFASQLVAHRAIQVILTVAGVGIALVVGTFQARADLATFLVAFGLVIALITIIIYDFAKVSKLLATGRL